MPTKKSPSKPRRPSVKEAKLVRENRQLKRERDEAREEQSATSDIMRTIARAPGELQSVLDTIAQNAAKLCDAADTAVWRVDGDVLRLAVHAGPIPFPLAAGEGHPLTRDTPTGRAVVDRETIHVHDLRAAVAEFPLSKNRGIASGLRTVLATPLLRDGFAIGAILIRRTEVRPFSESQIKLLETFADQAVIAIENARFIHEQQVHNRDLTEALEQQTATSEILGVIASSPTDIQPVLNIIAENAARICGTPDVAIFRVEDDGYRVVATYGSAPVRAAGETRPLDRGSVVGRAMVTARRYISMTSEPSKTTFWRVKTGAVQEGLRTLLAIPLLREGVAIGAIVMRRTEVNPFADKKLLC